MIGAVDPFIGTEATELPSPTGLAATWWWPKPQVGNTHPGACSPLGMVSACPYSGAYPTGYGRYDRNTEGVPPARYDDLTASGFTHFQQSGTGAIRKYYNYFRVTPMLGPLDDLGTRWPLSGEAAEPGYYRATLASGVGCELTVGPKSAVHRYRYPESDDARVVLDFSLGGLAIEHGETIPVRAQLASLGHGRAEGTLVVEGVPLSIAVECDHPEWRPMLWYDRRLMAGSTRLEFDAIRPTTLRPFGLIFRGPAASNEAVEVRLGFSLRGTDQAWANLAADVEAEGPAFDSRRQATADAWGAVFDRIDTEGGSVAQQQVFATAVYHSFIKPCFAPDESPFWPGDGPWVFDLATMWDIYKTQLPLLTTLAPERAGELAQALLHVCAEEGNFPIGYRMARGSDRFFRQGSALAHTFLADAQAAGLRGVDWESALVLLHGDLRRSYGEDYLEKGVAHPVTHTLDLAAGYHCTARVARRIGDKALADQLDAQSAGWTNAFDQTTGLLIDSAFYEGGRWNYSFRLLHDMASRIALAGGDEHFVALLDRFFGYDAEPVRQCGLAPGREELEAGYALDRFEGLNNEPDMEAPWSYHYAGRPDRTAEVVHAILANQFGVGRGGLPGNDDSGGLSSWYVWASLGLFPVAGQDVFLISTPAFRRCRLALGPARSFVIAASELRDLEATDRPQYVVGATLDGQRLDRAWLRGDELRAGGELRLDVADKPGTWGTDHRPPSTPFTTDLDTLERSFR